MSVFLNYGELVSIGEICLNKLLCL